MSASAALGTRGPGRRRGPESSTTSTVSAAPRDSTPNIHFRVTSASDLLIAWSACRNLVPTSCVAWRDGREVNDEARPNPEPGS
jgi:hypothetical protein